MDIFGNGGGGSISGRDALVFALGAVATYAGLTMTDTGNAHVAAKIAKRAKKARDGGKTDAITQAMGREGVIVDVARRAPTTTTPSAPPPATAQDVNQATFRMRSRAGANLLASTLHSFN